MTHLSLFSGIGGIDLAAHWAGFETVAFCERDPFCQKVLAKHWPGVPIYDDVCQLSGSVIEGRLTLMSAGFPCQPFSDAGKRQGTSDDRFLWPELVRLLKEVEPIWFLGENVAGLLTIESGLTFGAILRDLDEVGYRVGWAVYGAADVGAPHERDRVFILAHPKSQRWEAASPHADSDPPQGVREAQGYWRELWDAFARGRESLDEWADKRPSWFTRGDDGVPPGLDRFRALGNAVVPAQVFPILQAIAAHVRLMEAAA